MPSIAEQLFAAPSAPRSRRPGHLRAEAGADSPAAEVVAAEAAAGKVAVGPEIEPQPSTA